MKKFGLFLILALFALSAFAQIPAELDSIIRPSAGKPMVSTKTAMFMATTGDTGSSAPTMPGGPAIPPILPPSMADYVYFSDLRWVEGSADEYTFDLTIEGPAARQNVDVYQNGKGVGGRTIRLSGELTENEERVQKSFKISGKNMKYEFEVAVNGMYVKEATYVIPQNPPVRLMIQIREVTSSTVVPEGMNFGFRVSQPGFLVGPTVEAVERYRFEDAWDKRPAGVSYMEGSFVDGVILPQRSITGSFYGAVKLTGVTPWGRFYSNAVPYQLAYIAPPVPGFDVSYEFLNSWRMIARVSYKDMPEGTSAYVIMDGIKEGFRAYSEDGEPVPVPRCGEYWGDCYHYTSSGEHYVVGTGIEAFVLYPQPKFTYSMIAYFYSSKTDFFMWKVLAEGVKPPKPVYDPNPPCCKG